jgi:hypothetical protein
MDWNALVLQAGDPVRAFGRLVRNADGDWFEGPVSVPLIRADWVRRPTCAVPAIGANFDDLLDRHECDGDIEGTAIVTGTWTGSAVRVERQVAAAQPDEDNRLYRDRPSRTSGSPWTREEADEVLGHLRERWSEWNVYGSGIIDDHVEARLTRVLPEMATWLATLPPGILALDPWLVPATQPVRAHEPVP